MARFGPRRARARARQWAQSSSRGRWVVLATSLFGMFSTGVSVTILMVALPRIADDLGTSGAGLTWLVTGPMLGFAVVGPATGKLGDLHGHRRVFLVSLGVALVFTVCSALAWNATSLIAFRVLGASAAAAGGPASMAMINRLFPAERRAQAMGYWSLVMAGGPVLGVVAGGPIVEMVGWRAIFVAQVPLIVVAFVVCEALLPSTQHERHRPRGFDVAGTLLMAGSATSFVLALNRGPVDGWSSATVVGAGLLAVALAAVFVHHEQQIDEPLLPLAYVRRRGVVIPVITQILLTAAYMGGFVLTPLLLQEVLGYGETRTGLLSIFRPLALALSGPIVGTLSVRIGTRRAVMAGCGCVAISLVGLASVGTSTSDLLIAGSLALSGVGLGSASPSLIASIANAVEERDLGVVSAAQQMLTQLGIVAGIQLLQTVQIASAGPSGELASYGNAFIVGSALAVAAAASAALLPSVADEHAAVRELVTT